MAHEAEAAPPVVSAFGDSALLVRIGNGADPALTQRAWGIAEAIEAIRVTHPGIGRPVVGHASVLVQIDPLVVARADAVLLLTDATDVTARPVDSDHAEGEAVEIAVRYGGADGPDLDAVAAACGITAADVVALHAAATYRVLFLGFAPGFAYLRGLPTELATPRRASPRERVPAGSVGIAGEQTGIYPRDLPGGWNLIGRTDAVLFDVARPEPALLRPGSAVRFLPAP